MADDKIRLALEILGASDAKELAAQVRAMRSAFAEATPVATKLEADTYELADAYEVLGERQQSVLTSAAKVGVAMDPVTHAMNEVTAAAEREAEAIRKADANHARLAASGISASKGIGGLQQQIIAGSYAFQDFTATSGDLGAKLNSVSNNLPGLLVGLGSLGTAISIGATGAIALYRNWDAVSGLWETRMNVPPLTGDMERLKEAVDKNAEAVDKLRSKGKLTAEGLKELNDLTATQTRLEAEQSQARETEANRKAHGENANQDDKDRASGVGKAIDALGGFDAVADRLVQARMRNGNESEEDRDSIRMAVEETLNKALRGDKGARDVLVNEGRLDKSGLSGSIDLELERQDPVNARARKQAEEFDEAADKTRAELTAKEKKEARDFDRHAAEVYAALAAKEKKDAEEFDAQAAKDFARANKAETDVGKGAIKRANEAEDASIEGSGIGLEAGRMLAQARANGGMADQTGRFRKLTPDQQFEAVRRQVAQWLHRQVGVDRAGRPVRANAGMGAEETHDLSTRIAATGQQQVDRRMTGMAGKQLDNTGKLFQVAAGLNTEVAQLQAKIAQQGQMIDQLARSTSSRQRNARKR